MLELVVPRFEIEEDTGWYVRVVAEPLEEGFGITLGNALRRVLLSSLSGAAITSARIDQVQHEFSTIPHMKEDVIEFLLNVKQVRLKALADRPGRLYLDVVGEQRVTAGDIQSPPDFEIVNKDLHLATLDAPQARLTVEFQVELGRGWRPAGFGDSLSIDTIPVDAVYAPVLRANHRVEHSRVGQVTTYDRLILEIWTDGTITGLEALRQAVDILVGQFSLFRQLGQPPALSGQQRLGSGFIDPERYNTPIEALELSVRAYNCLKRSGLMTVGQVLEMSEQELLSLRNFGRKSYEEMKEKLIAMGFLLAAEAAEAGEELAGEEAAASPAGEKPATVVEEPAAAAAEEEELEEAGGEEIDPRLRQLLRLRRQLGE